LTATFPWVAALRAGYPDAVPVSAVTGEGIDDLRTAIERALDELERG
jgi:GTP-binding protein HflX